MDTIPPIIQITSHSNGEVVYGSVLLTGKLADETSGADGGELSVDGGHTWHSASVDADDTLSFAWDTNEVPNGSYKLQMRGLDVAGNLGDAPSPHIPLKPTQSTHRLPFWQVLGLLGLFLAISSASVVDPRPPALDRLRERIGLIANQNKIDSSNEIKEVQRKWK